MMVPQRPWLFGVVRRGCGAVRHSAAAQELIGSRLRLLRLTRVGDADGLQHPRGVAAVCDRTARTALISAVRSVSPAQRPNRTVGQLGHIPWQSPAVRSCPFREQLVDPLHSQGVSRTSLTMRDCADHASHMVWPAGELRGIVWRRRLCWTLSSGMSSRRCGGCVASGAFPINLTGFPRGQATPVPREDARLWEQASDRWSGGRLTSETSV